MIRTAIVATITAKFPIAARGHGRPAPIQRGRDPGAARRVASVAGQPRRMHKESRLIDCLTSAQTTAPAPTGPGGANALWIGMLLFLGVYMFMMFRNSKREQQKKKDLLAGIKKNDRVMTIGGIIGTVVAVRDNEVVLKVDETTNTKMTFRRGAVQQKLADDESPQEPTGDARRP